MRRLFWIAVGATATVYVLRRVDSFTQRYATAEGVAETLNDLGERFLEVWEDIRDAMNEREAELREALGLAQLERSDA